MKRKLRLSKETIRNLHGVRGADPRPGTYTFDAYCPSNWTCTCETCHTECVQVSCYQTCSAWPNCNPTYN